MQVVMRGEAILVSRPWVLAPGTLEPRKGKLAGFRRDLLVLAAVGGRQDRASVLQGTLVGAL